MHSKSLHLGREVSIYAFCGTLAAKVNLTSAVSSGEKGVGPDGRRLNIVLSTEIRVWPDGREFCWFWLTRFQLEICFYSADYRFIVRN